jgi:hypothetical protein
MALAVLSVVAVSPRGVHYRSTVIWSNTATLLISQPGFPEGRSVLPAGQPTPVGSGQAAFADTGRFSALVDLYAAFATSDAVIRQLVRRGLIKRGDDKSGASISANAVPSTVNGLPTPLLQIVGKGSSPERARRLTVAATNVLKNVVAKQQAAAKIPEAQRTVIEVIRASSPPTLVTPRSKTLPIVVLLAGLTATMGAAFIRENKRRSLHSVPGALHEVNASEPSAPQLVRPSSSNKSTPPVIPKETEPSRRTSNPPSGTPEGVDPSKWPVSGRGDRP